MAKAGRKPFINRDYTQDEYFKRWMVGLSEKTKRSYLFAFKEWLDFIGMSPTEQILKRGKDIINPNPIERQFFEDKWREYKELLETKETYTDSSIQSKLKVVASFFSRNGLRLNLKRGDWTSTQTQQVIKKKWIPTNEQLRRMYGHANLRDRALVLVLYQSGFSQIDVCNMKIEHLTGLLDNPETEHYFIEKQREKSTHIQATCLSFECVHDIKLMLHERENPTEGFLFVSQTKTKGEKLKTRTIRDAMKALAVRTFGEEKAKEFETKNLRQSYNSALLRANIQPQELKDLLMGHERKGARKNYAYDEITIKEAYVKAFKYLTINGIQSRKDIEELRKAQITQAKTLTHFAEENQKLKNFIDVLSTISNDELISKAIKQFKKEGYRETFVFDDRSNIHYTNEKDKNDSFSMSRTATALDYMNKLAEIRERKQKRENWKE